MVEARSAAGHTAPPLTRALAVWLGGEPVYRSRACVSCGRRWRTMELLQDDLQALRGALSAAQGSG